MTVTLFKHLTHCERRYVEKLIASNGRRSFRAKNCYMNAQRLILYDTEKRLRYWEGALNGSIPHAWVTIHGKVVDVTREAAQRKLKRLGIPPSTTLPDYSGGVYISRHAVLRHVMKTNEWGPIRCERDMLL